VVLASGILLSVSRYFVTDVSVQPVRPVLNETAVINYQTSLRNIHEEPRHPNSSLRLPGIEPRLLSVPGCRWSLYRWRSSGFFASLNWNSLHINVHVTLVWTCVWHRDSYALETCVDLKWKYTIILDVALSVCKLLRKQAQCELSLRCCSIVHAYFINHKQEGWGEL